MPRPECRHPLYGIHKSNPDKSHQNAHQHRVKHPPEVWNDKLSEIWQLITQSPQTFKGGSIWSVICSIHGALQAIGYALLVLFFVVGVVKTCGSFAELKKPEHAVKLFVRFAIAKGLITYGMELMMAILEIIQGVVSTIMNSAGFGSPQATVLPQEIITAVEDCGFFESIQVLHDPVIRHSLHLPSGRSLRPPLFRKPDQPTMRLRISFAKVMTTPPARVRKPLERWLGSWDWKLRPTCTMPQPSRIRIASMAFSFDKKAVKNAEKLEAEKHEFLLYSEEELEELLDEKEKKDNEET